jgi:3-methyladenine DNA glycosylase Mpg
VDIVCLLSDFYNRPTLTVARELLGCRLVQMLDGERIVGVITETEAYIGETDLGCHARAGRTVRTQDLSRFSSTNKNRPGALFQDAGSFSFAFWLFHRQAVNRWAGFALLCPLRMG